MDPKFYGNHMVEDIIGLMDYLSVKRANFFGYSMGARLTLKVIIEHPERVKSAILGGFSIPSPENPQAQAFTSIIVEALRVKSLDEVKNPVGKQFRRFADSTGENLLALAAVIEGFGREVEPNFSSMNKIKKTLKKIRGPILSVCGSDDLLLQNKTLFAELIPGACHFQIQGNDHLTVVLDPRFHLIVKTFLNYINRK
ncbi:MAG: alpha/beta fold hydrolase [Promethearchaeota archaeon]